MEKQIHGSQQRNTSKIFFFAFGSKNYKNLLDHFFTTIDEQSLILLFNILEITIYFRLLKKIISSSNHNNEHRKLDRRIHVFYKFFH